MAETTVRRGRADLGASKSAAKLADIVGGGPGNDALSGAAGGPEICTGDGGFDSADVTCERATEIP